MMKDFSAATKEREEDAEEGMVVEDVEIVVIRLEEEEEAHA